MRIVRWPWLRAMGETAIECTSHSKGRKPDMKRKYVCLIATVAWAGSAAGALAGDAAAGETIFTHKCKTCHQIGEGAKNVVGPELNGLIGRKTGSVPNYNYSDANKGSGITWDEAALKEYLVDPKAKIPGTKMVLPGGLPKESDRDDVIAYIAQFDANGKKK
jgi:cytochrome c